MPGDQDVPPQVGQDPAQLLGAGVQPADVAVIAVREVHDPREGRASLVGGVGQQRRQPRQDCGWCDEGGCLDGGHAARSISAVIRMGISSPDAV
jgi:hypothetical protein